MHGDLGPSLSFHNYVNVIGADVCREETPLAVQTNVTQSCEYDRPAGSIEAIGLLIHLPTFISIRSGLASASRVPGRL